MGFQRTQQNQPGARKPIPKVAPKRAGKRAAQKAIAKVKPKPERAAALAKRIGKSRKKTGAIKITGQSGLTAETLPLLPDGGIGMGSGQPTGKRSNRKTGAKLDPSSGDKTVEGMKATAEADKKKRGKLDQAATPKEPAADKPKTDKELAAEKRKAEKIERKEKSLTVMKARIKTMTEFSNTTAKELAAHAVDFFELTDKIEALKPTVAGLKGMVQKDTDEIMRLSKDAKSLKPDKADISDRLGSVGADLQRRKIELTEKQATLQGYKDERKADVQAVFEIIRDKMLGNRMFENDAAAAGAQVDGEMNRKPDAPTPEPENKTVAGGTVVTNSTDWKSTLPVGSEWVYTATNGPAAGKSATLRIVKVKGATVKAEVVADPTGALPIGSTHQFDAGSGTWGEVKPPAPAAAEPPTPPGPTHVPAPSPAWHRNAIEKAFDSLRPAAVHALKMKGLNTVGDVVRLAADPTEAGDLTEIPGITPADRALIDKAIENLAKLAADAAAKLEAKPPAEPASEREPAPSNGTPAPALALAQ